MICKQQGEAATRSEKLQARVRSHKQEGEATSISPLCHARVMRKEAISNMESWVSVAARRGRKHLDEVVDKKRGGDKARTEDFKRLL